ncbi:DMT family transporter [Streptacidiphilus sp. EB129]|jgi:drug/metabolite transporter (DMT)-like permease|uniref:DMT family transporter n=1 Tax=Streptacidiphilus sp. EB129 TaxID=3156262 RepID=UPI00351315CB
MSRSAPARQQSAGRLLMYDLPMLLVALVWGSSYLATKSIATEGTVVALLALRFLVALPVLLVAGRRQLAQLTRAEIRGGAVLGAMLSVIFMLEAYGVVHTSATNAGLIISMTMIITPLAESRLSRTPLPHAFMAAAGVSVVGVCLLTQGSGFTRPSLGDLLILIAAAARTVHLLMIHRMRSVQRTGSLSLTFLQLGASVLVFLVISPFAGTSPLTLARSFSPNQWGDLLYLALMCTVFALFVHAWAVRRTSPSRVSLLLGTEPLWAAVCAIVVGGERPGPAGICGAVLVLAGTTWGRTVAGRVGAQPAEEEPQEERESLPA